MAQGCRIAVVHFDGIEQALRQLAQRREDALSVSMMASFATSWLVPRLPRFVAAHPQLQLNLQSSADLVDFGRESVDAALRFGAGQWPGLRAEHLFDEWISPVASPALLERLGKPRLAELGRWPLLGDPNGRWRDWFARYGGTLPHRYVAHFNSFEAQRHAVLEGMGVAMGRMVMSRSLVDAGLLVVLGERYLPVQDAYWLVYPARSREHRGLQVFREWLLAEAAAYCRQMPQPEPVEEP